MNIRLLVAFCAIGAFVSCKTTIETSQPPTVPAIPVATPTLHNIDLNGKVYAAVFQQRAAEYKALCIQAFNVATYQLDNILKQPHKKPIAIVSDIDETFMDNSPLCCGNG